MVMDVENRGWGLIGPKNTANKLRVFCFCWLLNIFMGFWGFVNYSKIANVDSQTYFNALWMVSGTSKKMTKSGPSDPVVITRIFQNVQEIYGNDVEHIFHI